MLASEKSPDADPAAAGDAPPDPTPAPTQGQRRPGRAALVAANLVRWAFVIGLCGFAAWTWWRASTPRAAAEGVAHACPMHPTYVQAGAGSCPICGMDLVPQSTLGGGDAAPLDPHAAFRLDGISGVAATRIAVDRLQRAGVRSATVERRTLEQRWSVPARLSIDPVRRTAVTARTGGWVRHLPALRPGDPVRRGDILAELYSRELHEAQAEYVATTALGEHPAADGTGGVHAAAGARLLRLGMTQGGVRSLAAAKGVVRITAPATGLVLERSADVGGYAGPDTAMWVLGALDPLIVDADLPVDAAKGLRPGDEVAVELADGATRAVRVIAAPPRATGMTGLVRVRGEVANPDLTLRPDEVVHWRLARRAELALAVPDDAVIDIGVARYVYRTDDHGHVMPTRVVTGIRADGWVEVQQGLFEADLVIHSGVFLVDAESRVAVGAIGAAAAPTQAAAPPAASGHDHGGGAP